MVKGEKEGSSGALSFSSLDRGLTESIMTNGLDRQGNLYIDNLCNYYMYVCMYVAFCNNIP